MSGCYHRQGPPHHGHNAAAERRTSGGGTTNSWVWVRPDVSNSTSTSASTYPSAAGTAATNPDATKSGAPATFQQQHWPPFCSQNPPTSHQQRLYNRTAFKEALAVESAVANVLGGGGVGWRPPRRLEMPSALEKVEAAVAARKKLARGGEGAGGTVKSPGFHMRVDSYDGISDPEPALESIMALGNGNKRKRKQKQEESPKHTLSWDKLQEFIATWMELCREHSVETVLESMLSCYARPGAPKQMKRMKNLFTSTLPLACSMLLLD